MKIGDSGDFLSADSELHKTDYFVNGKGGRMKSSMKLLAVLVLSAAIFVAGYKYAAALYGEDIAALREDYASRSQALEEKYREKERVQYQSLVSAWEERDAALARVSSLSDDVDRVRKQSDGYRRRLSESTDAACKLEREQLARCAVLLERGAGVVGRCAGVAERIAIDKDAVVKVVTQ